jgi:hypothetical protein
MVIPPALCHYVLRSHLSTLGIMVAQVMVLLKVLMNPKKEQQLAKFIKIHKDASILFSCQDSGGKSMNSSKIKTRISNTEI